MVTPTRELPEPRAERRAAAAAHGASGRRRERAAQDRQQRGSALGTQATSLTGKPTPLSGAGQCQPSRVPRHTPHQTREAIAHGPSDRSQACCQTLAAPRRTNACYTHRPNHPREAPNMPRERPAPPSRVFSVTTPARAQGLESQIPPFGQVARVRRGRGNRHEGAHLPGAAAVAASTRQQDRRGTSASLRLRRRDAVEEDYGQAARDEEGGAVAEAANRLCAQKAKQAADYAKRYRERRESVQRAAELTR